MERDRRVKQRERRSKYDSCFEKLPEKFTLENLRNTYGIGKDAAYTTASRLCDDGYVKRLSQGKYVKLKKKLI